MEIAQDREQALTKCLENAIITATEAIMVSISIRPYTERPPMAKPVVVSDSTFEQEVLSSALPTPVSYTHLTLPTNREV